VPEIETVLATVNYADEEFALLRRAFEPANLIRIGRGEPDRLRQALAVADVAVIEADIDRRYLAAPNLKWVHIDKAGLDGSASPEVFDRGLWITGSGGRSDPALAEHALFFMLALAYKAPAFYAAQRKARWGIAGQDELRALHGRTVGILGLGHIGKALAVRCKALGMRVLGYRRSDAPPPDGVDRAYSADRGEGFDALLEESDFLALALPLTDATHGLIGAGQLGRMKRTAFLINMARGALVDETALAEALRHRRLAGAGLDVFSVEPLPRAHPLWRTPNTLITPHVTPRLADRTARSIEIIGENARRYRAGEPLLNLLTRREVYSRGAEKLREPTPHRDDPARRLYRLMRRSIGQIRRR
jgi:phosphoglycerate dehydrogenase-like enzyme